MKFVIMSNDGGKWTAKRWKDIYVTIVEKVYDCGISDPPERVHMEAANAEGWCEIPEGDLYESNDGKFIIEIQ